jgi:hypothetical protein
MIWPQDMIELQTLSIGDARIGFPVLPTVVAKRETNPALAMMLALILEEMSSCQTAISNSSSRTLTHPIWYPSVAALKAIAKHTIVQILNILIVSKIPSSSYPVTP